MRGNTLRIRESTRSSDLLTLLIMSSLDRNKITDMVRLADQFNAGARGYDCEFKDRTDDAGLTGMLVPNGFSLRCRAYWGNDEAWRP